MEPTMSDELGGGSFLDDVQLDFGSEQLSPEEQTALLSWYRKNHGPDESLTSFLGYLIRHDPKGFKGYRRHIREIDSGLKADTLPDSAHLLMFVYSYACMANAKGTLYAVINSRKLGASRQEIMDELWLAGPTAGPYGLSAVGDLTDQYLQDWPESQPGPGISWPTQWSPDPTAFRSGIDLLDSDLLPGEVEMVAEWCLRMFGEVPSYVPILARLHPRAFKTQRARFEASLGATLPPQMATLSMLHLAAIRQWRTGVRRAAQMSKALGVTERQLLATIFWAGLYGGETIMEPAVEAIQDLLGDGWDGAGE
jgi:hypothetical protein